MIQIIKSKDYSRKQSLASRLEISKTVREIIADVAINGDKALDKYERKFSGHEAGEVHPDYIEEAVHSVGEDYLSLLISSASSIRQFHEKQLREGFMYSPAEGIILGQKVTPLECVGVYVPGGTAAYPSSVLMNVIPAEIAGCEEIIIATPNPTTEILAAAFVAGASRVFRMGGAQAIAAMAYGTESVPAVDKITGPGNAYVAEAKRQVFGHVAIDMIAGPSEIVIIADKTNNPAHMAADMLAQAEHDPSATAILITDNAPFAKKVAQEIETQLEHLDRREIARSSIDNNGRIIIAKSLLEAAEIANYIAPEHLELCVPEPFDYMTRIRNAGSIFLGRNSPEALGDYYAGPNHTLPTMGTARFSSPLSVDDFVKKSQYIYYSDEALSEASSSIEAFAKSEGLTGHANSITIRRK